MNDLIAVLIALCAPLLIAVICARRWNFIHGIFMYLFVSFIIFLVASKVPAFEKMLVVDGVNYNLANLKVLEYIHNYTLGLIKPLENLSFAIWIRLAVWVVLFIILQAIASKIRGSRKDKQLRRPRAVVEDPKY